MSSRLTERSRATLNLRECLRIVGLTPRHVTYLAWHRRIFSAGELTSDGESHESYGQD